MRIYKMTATFGKLSNETLTLKPGLNVIEAPNEWGKSTWCSFLVAMLYGIDTAERSKQGSLADKERYAPWSGEPMSGTIELRWNGRDITIERSAARRVPLGQFRAYETLTGLPVKELTAANCGQMLLGVERSVFVRSGFIRFRDLPVSEDPDLRKRLNALVTTGDESGTAQRLEQQLRDLKNRCRHNKTGLLPQFEADRSRLQFALDEKVRLQQQVRSVQSRLSALDSQILQLKTHQSFLDYDAYLRDSAQLEDAQTQLNMLTVEKDLLTDKCKDLDSPETIREHQQNLRQLLRQRSDLSYQAESLALTALPLDPPACFRDKSADCILQEAREDAAQVENLFAKKKRQNMWSVILGICLPVLAFCGSFLAANSMIYGFFGLIGGLLAAVLARLILKLAGGASIRKKLKAIYARHPNEEPVTWISEAETFCARLNIFLENSEAAQSIKAQLEQVQQQLDSLTGGCEPQDALDNSERALGLHSQLQQLLLRHQTAADHLAALKALVKPVEPPQGQDVLSYSPGETASLLMRTESERNQLQLALGQALGRAESGQSPQELRDNIYALDQRIARLEETYAALALAQSTLAEANAQLQRRFAPRITQRARDLFRRMTGERYDRILLDEDLSLSAGAKGENQLRSVLWRSDGTADQLYLALRLAVATELTPHAPVVLDDALVRFDDSRLQNILNILQEEGQQKQILLFSCQGREKTMLGL